MKEIMQFSDDIFYLNELVKTISTACELNLNKKLFREKIIADVQFAASSLNQLAALIENNATSSSSIRSLLKSQAALKEMLEKVLSSTTFMSALDEDEKSILEEEIKELIQEQNEKINRTIEMLHSVDKKEDPSIFISQEEMNLLLEMDDEK